MSCEWRVTRRCWWDLFGSYRLWYLSSITCWNRCDGRIDCGVVVLGLRRSSPADNFFRIQMNNLGYRWSSRRWRYWRELKSSSCFCCGFFFCRRLRIWFFANSFKRWLLQLTPRNGARRSWRCFDSPLGKGIQIHAQIYYFLGNCWWLLWRWWCMVLILTL